MSSLPTAPEPAAFAGKIGVARCDITPPIGIAHRNWGAAQKFTADSIHRAISVGAIVIQSTENDVQLVLIEADYGFWADVSALQAIRSQVREQYRLDDAQVIVSITHTHANARLIESPESIPGGDLLPAWGEHLVSQTLLAVQQAMASVQPAILEWHVGRCQLAAARDLVDPAHPERRICGYDPSVTADDTLLLGRVTDMEGHLLAVIVNYACHPTTLAWENHAISPDFVGATRAVIAQHTSNAEVFFLQGASGELAPKYQYVGDPAVADRHGRQLGFAALATLEDMDPPGTQLAYQGVVESGAPLAIWKPVSYEPSRSLAASSVMVELPLKDLPSSSEILAQLETAPEGFARERLRRKLDVRRKVGEGDAFALPVSAWRLGNAILVGTMTEAYSQFQTELRRRFPDQRLICLNMINGWIGYLPPRELYAENIYQVWQSPFAEGGLEKTIDTATGLIEQLLTN
ncbi:neutral/alkaline non-lysosomal ceramidase N-terminal domain-containing protein [Planctomicrobium piriforme]|uniref:Neutral/alkaline non-lysosomal ceramidase, N-terminal n=1 Tax=Planctomicrobium piriforme TaxID=1576369 RepID=A0A1I3MI75_9PLAN|nr:neutral/alkaline non-lysosomal ceramidase N-terminal domain-containing protein [Planctomicrobium piriforme]SFI96718.1 Neutral/alkaline non-lysosomal ceramidase, N-terminal [Planctomicrobium piriforme]